jgi:hypothetical protein
LLTYRQRETGAGTNDDLSHDKVLLSEKRLSSVDFAVPLPTPDPARMLAMPYMKIV